MYLVYVRAAEVAVQRRLEVERSGAGVGDRQLSFERCPVQRHLVKHGSVNKTSLPRSKQRRRVLPITGHGSGGIPFSYWV